jgi:hypothetical protein
MAQNQRLIGRLRPKAVTAVSCAGKTCGQSRVEVRTLTSQKKLTLTLFLGVRFWPKTALESSMTPGKLRQAEVDPLLPSP